MLKNQQFEIQESIGDQPFNFKKGGGGMRIIFFFTAINQNFLLQNLHYKIWRNLDSEHIWCHLHNQNVFYEPSSQCSTILLVAVADPELFIREGSSHPSVIP